MHPAEGPPGARRRWRDRLVLVLLLGGFVAGMAIQFHTGLADNGDFTRSIKFFSSGPVGIRPNFPPPGTPLWHDRFYEYWLPDWTLQRHNEKIVTTAVLLWLPGVLASAVSGSSTVSLPWLSLVPRAILLAELWVLLRWAARQPAGRWLPWTLGLPLVLLLTTTDNAVYLNSFYQEAASQAFVLPVLFSLVGLKARPTGLRLALFVGSVALLTAAKSSTIYWPLLALPFGLYAWTGRDPARWHRRAAAILASGLAVACLLTVGARRLTDYREANVNPYHSLFYGALMFSREPAEHLQRLGLADGVACIGVSAYDERGKAYFNAHLARMSFLNTLSTLAHEPSILWRMGCFGLDAMQDISLEYLGKYAPDDPRRLEQAPWGGIAVGSETRLWDAPHEATWVNLWSNLKFHAFPTGAALAFTLAGFAAFGAYRLRAPGPGGDLALAGLLAALATVADMAVAMLGEGRHELIKHLYFANLLFDLAAIASLNGVLLWLRELAAARQPDARTAQITSAKERLARMNTAYPTSMQTVPPSNCQP